MMMAISEERRKRIFQIAMKALDGELASYELIFSQIFHRSGMSIWYEFCEEVIHVSQVSRQIAIFLFLLLRR